MIYVKIPQLIAGLWGTDRGTGTRQPEGTIYRYLTGISKPRDLRERKMVGKYIERPLQLTKTSALTSGLLRGASYPH